MIRVYFVTYSHRLCDWISCNFAIAVKVMCMTDVEIRVSVAMQAPLDHKYALRWVAAQGTGSHHKCHTITSYRHGWYVNAHDEYCDSRAAISVLPSGIVGRSPANCRWPLGHGRVRSILGPDSNHDFLGKEHKSLTYNAPKQGLLKLARTWFIICHHLYGRVYSAWRSIMLDEYFLEGSFQWEQCWQIWDLDKLLDCIVQMCLRFALLSYWTRCSVAFYIYTPVWLLFVANGARERPCRRCDKWHHVQHSPIRFPSREAWMQICTTCI